MGESAGLEGVLLAPGPTMPVPLKKARGQPGRMLENNPYCRAAIPGGGEWPGQALQDVTILQATGGGGGGRGGNVLMTINITVPLPIYANQTRCIGPHFFFLEEYYYISEKRGIGY